MADPATLFVGTGRSSFQNSFQRFLRHRYPRQLFFPALSPVPNTTHTPKETIREIFTGMGKRGEAEAEQSQGMEEELCDSTNQEPQDVAQFLGQPISFNKGRSITLRFGSRQASRNAAKKSRRRRRVRLHRIFYHQVHWMLRVRLHRILCHQVHWMPGERLHRVLCHQVQ